ncbi:NUDIX domain-containing protein [Streptosporangium sp. NPDC002721]|uniref:NUDIX domain-containing protein n=1 Tax=Streptosporangium sp. NPDC002721 TaxID=3366188 RepID=UPI0036BAC327
MDAEEYRRGLARHPAASALFVTDEADRVLLVRPTYKEGWEFPGGAVEEGETPWEAATREAAEELGVTCSAPPAVLLCVDWMRPRGPEPGGFRLVFDGGILDERQRAAIRLPPDELDAWRMVDAADADAFLPPQRARRLRACLSARRTGRTAYLQDGVSLTGITYD